MSLNFHPSMKPLILLVLYCINSLESWWWCNSVGDIFFLLAHFQPCLIFFTDHAHPFMIAVYPFSSDYFQKDKTQCHEAQIISNCFLEHKNEFTVFKWPLSNQSPWPLKTSSAENQEKRKKTLSWLFRTLHRPKENRLMQMLMQLCTLDSHDFIRKQSEQD